MSTKKAAPLEDPVVHTEAAEAIGPVEQVLRYIGTDIGAFSPGFLRGVQVVAIVVLVLGMLLGLLAFIRWRTIEPPFLAFPIFVGVLILCLYPPIARGRLAYSRRLVVGQKGIAYFELGKAKVILWDDLTEVRWSSKAYRNQFGAVTITIDLQIKGREGQVIKAKSADYDEIGFVRMKAEGELIRRFFHRAWESYEKGIPSQFGDVTVSSDGLVVAGTELPWRVVRRVRVDDTHLEVRRVIGKPVRVDAGKVPNLAVCVALIDKVLEVERPEEPEGEDDFNFDR